MTKIEVVLPVLNEQRVLEDSVRTLYSFLRENLEYDWSVTIADNGSIDATGEIADCLATELPNLKVMHIPEAGRGRALNRAWLASDAHVISYMDIDLSTDLGAFPQLVRSIVVDGLDIAAGTRLGKGTQTERSLKREVLSRGFVFLINLFFGTRLRDTQCGFKAVSRTCAQMLLPHVQDSGWFWDTELFLLAAKSGWDVGFVRVRWVEDKDSRVKIVRTVWRDIKGLIRMHSFDWSTVAKLRSSNPGDLAASKSH